MITKLLSIEEMEELVKDFPEFYQSVNWMKAIEESYKLKPFIVALIDSEKILNSIPFFLIDSIFFGKKLVSMPYGDYGGFFSDVKTDWLMKNLEDLAKENDVDYIEIRDPDPKRNLSPFETKFTYCRFTLNLNKPLGDIWKSFDKKVRNNIRKAEKNNVKTIEGNKEELKDFYELYLKTMKKLGSPPHSFNFFKNIFNFCSNNMKLIFAEHEGKRIAASIFFLYNKKIYYWKNVSDEEYLSLRPNDLIIYKIIEFGQKEHYETLDLGRARMNTGGFLFKSRWGGRMDELKYYYRVFKDVKIPDPDEEKYKSLGKVWALIPNFLTRRMGYIIRKNYP